MRVKTIFLFVFFMLTSCFFQKEKKTSQQAYTVNGTSVTIKDLNKNNPGWNYEERKKEYERVLEIASEAYLDQFWKNLAKEKKVTEDKARKEYFSEKIKISTFNIARLSNQLSENPKFSNLSDEEREKQVKIFLEDKEKARITKNILSNALKSKTLQVFYPKPKQPRISLVFDEDDIMRYGPKLNDTKPINCKAGNCPIKIVEYSEFQCPFCARIPPIANKIFSEKEFSGKVVWVVRDFPLNFHDRAIPSAIAARCSGFQGKYWEMYDLLFKNQSKLSDENFEQYSKEIGLDIEEYKQCYKKSKKAKEIVDKNYNSGIKANVRGTPTVFINGLRVVGADYDSFKSLIKNELERN